jgi:4,5-DOPA dioxygenase extradiol
VRATGLAGDHQRLIDYPRLDPGAALSIPTPEHYLPLLYVLALAQGAEPVSIPVDGLELGAISMLGVQVGGYSTVQKQ